MKTRVCRVWSVALGLLVATLAPASASAASVDVFRVDPVTLVTPPIPESFDPASQALGGIAALVDRVVSATGLGDGGFTRGPGAVVAAPLPTPIPAALPLFGGAVVALGAIGYRRRKVR